MGMGRCIGRQGRSKLGEDHPETLTCANSLAMLLQAFGRLEEAESLYREALEGRGELRVRFQSAVPRPGEAGRGAPRHLELHPWPGSAHGDHGAHG